MPGRCASGVSYTSGPALDQYWKVYPDPYITLDIMRKENITVIIFLFKKDARKFLILFDQVLKNILDPIYYCKYNGLS